MKQKEASGLAFLIVLIISCILVYIFDDNVKEIMLIIISNIVVYGIGSESNKPEN